MPAPLIPPVLGDIFQRDRDPQAVFADLLPTLGSLLQCDRCFLYLRHPQTRLGKVVGCWRQSPDYPVVEDEDWKPEPDTLAQEDPLFAAALQTQPSVYVEDVETADPRVVNRDFEHKTFGHRALIHAHLCWDDQLWGILQPCVFDRPRSWIDFDRAILNYIEQELPTFVIDFVQQHAP